MQTILRSETIHPRNIRHKSRSNATNPGPFHQERLGVCSFVRSWYAHCLAHVSAIRTLAGFMDSSSAMTSSLLPSMYFPSNRYLLLASSWGQRRTNSSISSFEIRRSSICRCSAICSDCCIRVSFCTLKSSYFYFV